MFYKNAIYQKGVGLIEVLVAIIVLAVGLLALMSFQTEALRSSSDARNRTIATNLAEDRMEQLRAEDFDNIVDGTEAVAGTVVNANTPFTVNWTQTLSGAGNAEHKEVAVQVRWADEAGDTQQVTLTSIINSSLPTDPGRTNTGDLSGTAGPQVDYAPQAAPEVVSIPVAPLDVGNLYKQTTKPEPEVVADSGTTQVDIEEVFFESDGSDSTTVRRDSSRIMNCVCIEGRSDSNSGLSPVTFGVIEDKNNDSIFQDSEFQESFEGAEAVSGKPVGSVATGQTTIDGNKLKLGDQPDLCDICCRDHHDHATNLNDPSPVLFDPFRPSGDFSAENSAFNHNRYFPDSAGSLQANNLDGNPNEPYLEACNFKRVNGIWRVAPDRRLEELQVLAGDDIVADSGAALQAYVATFIRAYIDAIDLSVYPQTTPDVTAFSSTNYVTALNALRNFGNNTDSNGDGNVDGDGDSDEEEPFTTALASSEQLFAFGIYIDLMSDALVQFLKNKRTDELINGENNLLQFVPFSLVNVTGLARWSLTGDPDISVTDDTIDKQNFDSYSRGLVSAEGDGGTAVIHAVIERSNSGLTDTRHIDNDDDDSLNDAIQIVFGAEAEDPGITIVTVTGEISVSNKAGSLSPGIVTVTAGENVRNCQKPTDETYECTLILPTDSEVNVSDLNFSIVFSNYNYEFPPTDKVKGKPVACTVEVLQDNETQVGNQSDISEGENLIISITGDNTRSEFTTFQIDGSVVPTESTTAESLELLTLNIKIEDDGDTSTQSCAEAGGTFQ